MTLRDVLTAVGAALLILPLMAAAAFGLLVFSVATADHAAVAEAIGATPSQEIGVPDIDHYRNGFREGYFPECAGLSLLLGEARAPSPMVAVIRSETILPPPERTICADLQSVLRGEEAGVTWFTYARYWHGSLLLHRAVLGAASYATLQTIAFVLIGAGLALLLGALAWRVGAWPAAALVAVLALLTGVVAIGGLPMQAVSLAALFACAAGFAALAGPLRGAPVLIAAGVSGAAYNFLDFFCNPECLAALCAWAWAACGLVRGERRSLFGIACVFAAVMGGYGGFWAAKWVIAAFHAAAGGEVYLFNGGDLDRWGPGGGDWFPGLALGSAIGQAFDAWWKGAVALAVIAVSVIPAAAKLRAGTQGPQAPVVGAPGSWVSHAFGGLVRDDTKGRLALLLLPTLLAWIVVEALAGHTIVHTAITFRVVPLSLGLMLASALVLVQMAPLSRKAAISAAA